METWILGLPPGSPESPALPPLRAREWVWTLLIVFFGPLGVPAYGVYELLGPAAPVAAVTNVPG